MGTGPRGSHGSQGAAQRKLGREAAVVGGHLEHALGGEEDVVRLEVAVDDLRLVEVHQRVG